ncbi:MAG TPA: metallophosphoesterase [Minicystis sp.]|nr:metallophosphoesterase [Minicystis sp.]
MPRVVRLPDRGKLIVATDFQGNVPDFDRVADVFEQAMRGPDGAYLVVTGDLVHGPELSELEWPDYLGSYYHGDSKGVLERAYALAQRYPGRVHYLLGNHEHAHVGGPVVSKFFPDEARRLEELLGDEGTRRMRAWIRTWPFVALAPSARILMLHAAPHARIESAADLERLPLDGFFDMPLDDHVVALGASPPSSRDGAEMADHGILGALLWARTTSSERAYAFLRAIDPAARVAVYGHDVARAGYAIDREPLLCVSTSFGCFDGDKLYVEWDLARPAESAVEVAAHGLRVLHPHAPPVHRA